tara:strand:+ start:171 stop:1223 length:1053 start_codon:yes stop_codon:yes gene_type:complete
MHSAKNHNDKQLSLIDGSKSPYTNKKYDFGNRFSFIDLFAGIGGFRLGLEALDVDCLFSSEWDLNAKKTYQKNFSELPHGDINDVKIETIPKFDILTAGFPCQPFSKIGMRQGFKHKTQGNLFFNIAGILRKKKPISFILENVSGLLTHKSNNKKTLDIMFSELEKIGYEINYKLIDSSNFGVPQIRRRIFIVGFLKKHFPEQTNFNFPKGNKIKNDIGKFIESHKGGYCISKKLQKNYIYKLKDKFPEIVNRNSKIQVKTLVSSYHKIQRITGTFVKDGKTGLRLLSENECKAIMGFPKKFIFPVSRTQMYRQLGNAVVVPVVKAIAKEVVKVLEELKKSYGKKLKKSA